MTGTTSLHEIRVAWALTLDPDLKGLRAIERASGLSRDSVLNVIPQTGQTGDLLHCANRGVWGWEESERVPMQVSRVLTPFDHNSFSTYIQDNYVWEGGGTSSTSDWGVVLVEEDQRVIGDRRMSLLDPALDLWTNSPSQLGDYGWALAFLTQCGRGRFSWEVLADLWRMSTRQARRIADKLVTQGWAVKTRVGLRTVLDVDFEYLLTEEGFNDYGKSNRLAHKSQQHALEADAVRTMGTEQGRTVREMAKNARAEAAMLRDWAEMTGSRCWDNLIWILDKRALPRTAPGWISRWTAERLIFKDLGPVRA